MRELSIEDVEQVSGSGPTEAVALWTTALGITALSGIATLGVFSAFAAAPIVAVAALGLSFAGGWQFNQPSNLQLGTVTVGGDYRESDC